MTNSHRHLLLDPGFAEKGYLAVALDLPGHGTSYRPDKEPDLATLSEGALAAVKALGLEEPVDYLGHHTGVKALSCLTASRLLSNARLSVALKV